VPNVCTVCMFQQLLHSFGKRDSGRVVSDVFLDFKVLLGFPKIAPIGKRQTSIHPSIYVRTRGSYIVDEVDIWVRFHVYRG